MIATSTAPVRFVPSWFDADDPASPVFYLRAGSVIERGLLEAELSGEYRAAPVYDFQLAGAFADGIAALLADDPGRDTLIALAASEAALKEGETLDATERQMLAQARAILAEHWPAYRSLLAQLARRRQLLPLVALRRFCAGWENVTNDDRPVAFARGLDGLVSLDAAGALPELVMKVVGAYAYDLLYPGAHLKNSAAPAKSAAARRTSRSGAASQGAGKSRAKNTRKTR